MVIWKILVWYGLPKQINDSLHMILFREKHATFILSLHFMS